MVFLLFCFEVEIVIVVIVWGVGVCIIVINKIEELIKIDLIILKKIFFNKWLVFFSCILKFWMK